MAAKNHRSCDEKDLIEPFVKLSLSEKPEEGKEKKGQASSHSDDIAFTVCSWNFNPGNGTKRTGVNAGKLLSRQEMKACLKRTLSLIEPSVVLLQEHVWAYQNIKRHMSENEGDDFSTSIPWNYECNGVRHHKEAAILYDPDKFDIDTADQDIKICWQEKLTSIEPDLPPRSISGTLKLKMEQGGQGTPVDKYIFISIHMVHNEYVQDQRVAFSRKVIKAALELCDEYKRVVIIGADWNCPINMIPDLPEPENERVKMISVPHSSRVRTHEIDSLVIIFPEQETVMMRNPRRFSWNVSDLNQRDYHEVYSNPGTHKPLVCDVSLP